MKDAVNREMNLWEKIKKLFSSNKTEDYSEGIYHIGNFEGYVFRNADVLEPLSKPQRYDFKPERIDANMLLDYHAPDFKIRKSNTSAGFYGSSRSGKSRLALYLTGQRLLKGHVIFVFSIKERDVWLSLSEDFRLVNVAKGAPNPFLHDVRILIDSLLLALSSVSSIGINVSSIESILAKACNPVPKNWDELLNRLRKMQKGSDLGPAHESLILRVEQYANIPIIDDFVITKENTVFNFEGLTKDTLRFFANLTMSVVYETMKNSENKNLTLVLDEAHSYIPREASEAERSIASLLFRTGSGFGEIFLISQQMSDMPYFCRENCGHNFCFATHSAMEVGLIPDRIHKDVIQHLGPYEFIDLQANYGTFCPIFRLFTKREEISVIIYKVQPQRNENQIETESSKEVKVSAEQKEQNVLEVLEKSEFALYYSQIASSLGYPKNSIERLSVSTILKGLAREGKIAEKDYVTPTLKPGQKPRHYYYSIPDGESKLHRTMIRDVKSVLAKLDVKFDEGLTNQGFDVYVPDKTNSLLYIECETSLKNSLKEFNDKLKSADKMVLSVACNEQDRERYMLLESVGAGKTKIVLLNELAITIKGLQIGIS